MGRGYTVSLYTYVDADVSTRATDIEILDERVANVPYGQLNVGSLDCEGLKAIKVARDSDKDLESDSLFEFFFKGRVDRVCILIAVLNGLECGRILDNGFACLY